MDAADVQRENADVVIVATGSTPRMDGVQAMVPAQAAMGVDLPHVISSTDLLTDRMRVFGENALVFDDVGHYEAVAAADYLIAKGVAVTFATRCSSFAPIVDSWTRAEPALERLQRGRFRLLTRMQLLEVRIWDSVLHHFRATPTKLCPLSWSCWC
jgi:hypothetical protein